MMIQYVLKLVMSDQLELANRVEQALNEAGIKYNVEVVYPDSMRGALDIELRVYDE